MTLEQIATILGAVGGSGILAAWINRRKRAAEGRKEEIAAEVQLVNVATELLEPLKGEVKRLSDRVETLETENGQLRVEIRNIKEEHARIVKDLRRQVEDLRVTNQSLREENAALRGS